MEHSGICKMGANIDTDQVIASQYLQIATIDEMKKYTFETLRPGFAKTFQRGDIIVAGENFGCGSSREQAPGVLKALGTKAIVAKSFARIFFRNSINIGLNLIVCKEIYKNVQEGDRGVLLMGEGEIIVNRNRYFFDSFPANIREIISEGGLIRMINNRSEKEQ